MWRLVLVFEESIIQLLFTDLQFYTLMFLFWWFYPNAEGQQCSCRCLPLEVLQSYKNCNKCAVLEDSSAPKFPRLDQGDARTSNRIKQSQSQKTCLLLHSCCLVLLVMLLLTYTYINVYHHNNCVAFLFGYCGTVLNAQLLCGPMEC